MEKQQKETKAMDEIKIPFSEWFDVYNVDHIKAWQYLMEKGVWPEYFIPADIEIDIHWHIQCQIKMAEAWIQFNLLVDRTSNL